MTNKENAVRFCKEWREGKSSFTFNTSGSTGAPKNIEVRSSQMISSATKTIKALDLKKGMTSLVCLDVNFIAGSMMLVRSMMADMEMIIIEPTANPLENLSDKVDFVAMVPYQMSAIIASPERTKLDHVGKIILGGAPISHQLSNDIQQLKVPVYATFGMTETLSHIALQKLNGVDRQNFFETLDGINISVDARECLVIKADYLDEVVVTNDVVELTGPRSFRWLGRYDNIINSGGVKVVPEKVEEAVGAWLTSHGFDNKFFVGGIVHDRLGMQVTLVIEGWIFRESEEKLLEALRNKLAKYEVPKKVMYSTSFVYTSTGKINRKLSIENALPRPSSLR